MVLVGRDPLVETDPHHRRPPPLAWSSMRPSIPANVKSPVSRRGSSAPIRARSSMASASAAYAAQPAAPPRTAQVLRSSTLSGAVRGCGIAQRARAFPTSRASGPDRTTERTTEIGCQNGRQNGPPRGEAEARSSCRPPKRRRALPLKGSGEQGGQQLDRLCFLSSGKRLDPHRAEPDLTVIDCLGAQRHNLAAAAWHIVIVHRLSTRRQRSQTSTVHPPRRIRPAGNTQGEISLYIERPFSAPKNHTRARRLTRPLPAQRPCRRRVSDGSVEFAARRFRRPLSPATMSR